MFAFAVCARGRPGLTYARVRGCEFKAPPAGSLRALPKRALGILFSLAAALLCTGDPLVAQTISTASPILYPTPTVAHYDAGSGPTHRISVNVSGFGGGNPGFYEVRMQAMSVTLGNSKPVGHIRFTRPCGTGGPTTGCGVWSTLGTSYQNILPQTTGDLTFSIDFQVTSWSWSADTPLTYEVTLDLHAYNTAGGKNAYVQPTFRIQVNPLAVVSTSSSSVTFPAVTSTDFNTGWVQAGTSTSITTKANVAHSVVIKAATANFSSTNPLASIPASDQQWSSDVGGSWSAWAGLSTGGSTVVSRSAGNYVTPFSVRHRQLLVWARSRNGTHSLSAVLAVQQ